MRFGSIWLCGYRSQGPNNLESTSSALLEPFLIQTAAVSYDSVLAWTRIATDLVKEAFGHGEISLVGNHVLAREDDVRHDLQSRWQLWRHFHTEGYASLRHWKRNGTLMSEKQSTQTSKRRYEKLGWPTGFIENLHHLKSLIDDRSSWHNLGEFVTTQLIAIIWGIWPFVQC